MNIITKLVSGDKTYNYICNGNLKNNKLNYNENGINVTFDLDEIKIIRESQDYIIEYVFYEEEVTENKIYLKELNKYLNIHIYTNHVIVKDNYIEIEYKLVDDGSVITYIINYGG